MANEYYLDHVAFIIGRGEGTVGLSGNTWYIKYDIVEQGSPFEGIGLLQWSFGRSFDILRDIYVALGNNFGGTTPPSEIANAITGNNRWDSHKWYQKSTDTTWVREFLMLDKAKEVQGEKYIHEIQEYLDKLEKQGVTDLRARGYCADISNQYGTGVGNVFGGGRFNGTNAKNIDKAYDFSPKKYATRRKTCYKYLKTADFDKPAPVTYSVPNVTIKEDDSVSYQDEPEPTLDANLAEIELESLQLLEESYVTKSGKSYYNDYFKIMPVTGRRYNTVSFYVKSLTDIYAFFREEEEIIEKVTEKKKEKEEKDKNEQYEKDVNAIDDLSLAVKKVVEKANSYPDSSVVYSMKGKRDMISSGDCSCFTDICYQEAGLKLGGWSGAQYDTLAKQGKIIVEGGRSVLPQLLSKAQIGDLVLMTKTGTKFVAGGASHVGIVVAVNTFRHQSNSGGITGKKGYGPTSDPLDQYVNNYVSNYQHFALGRPIKK